MYYTTVVEQPTHHLLQVYSDSVCSGSPNLYLDLLTFQQSLFTLNNLYFFTEVTFNWTVRLYYLVVREVFLFYT